MKGWAVLRSYKILVKKEEEAMDIVDVAKPSASSDFGPQVVEVMRNVRETICSVCSSQSVDSQEHANEH